MVTVEFKTKVEVYKQEDLECLLHALAVLPGGGMVSNIQIRNGETCWPITSELLGRLTPEEIARGVFYQRPTIKREEKPKDECSYLHYRVKTYDGIVNDLGLTLALLEEPNTDDPGAKTYRVGVALCNGDNFCKETGRKLAKHRLMNSIEGGFIDLPDSVAMSKLDFLHYLWSTRSESGGLVDRFIKLSSNYVNNDGCFGWIV